MLRRGIDSLSRDFRDLAEATLDFSPLLHSTEPFDGDAPLRKLLEKAERSPVVAVVGLSDSGKTGVLDLLVNPEDDAFQRMSNHNDVATLWSYFEDHPPVGNDEVGETPELPLGLDKEKQPAPVIRKGFYPDPSLHFVHLMDTCGIDTDDDHKTRLKEALATADVFVIVVSARAWQDLRIWEFLAELPSDKIRRSLIALTHADEFSDEKVVKMEQSLREFALHYIKCEPISVPVCTTGKQRGGGSESLSKFVNRAINTVQHEQKWNKKVLDAVAILFQQQAEVLRNQSLLQHMDTTFITDVERGIDREFNATNLTKTLGDFRGLVQKQIQDMLPSLAKQVASQMGFILSPSRFLAMPRLGFLIDYSFYEQLREDIELVVNGYNYAFVSICRTHWQDVRPQVKDHLKCDIGEFPEESLKQRLEVYKKRIGDRVYLPLVRIGLRSCLNDFFKRQERWMRTQIILILCIVILADLFGFLGENFMAVCLLLVSCALWFINSVGVLFIRRYLYKRVLQQAQLIPSAVADELVPVMDQISRSEVCDYRQFFTDIRGQVALIAEQIEPLKEKHSRIQNARMILANRLQRRGIARKNH
jgi:hypothetical protein